MSNVLFDSNKRLVPYIIKKYIIKTDFVQKNYKDILQEGYIALYHASEKYDASRNIKFSTYASRSIYNKIISYIKNTDPGYKKTYLISLEKTLQQTHNPDRILLLQKLTSANPEDISTNDLSITTFLKKRHLTPQQNRILILRSYGYSYREISKKLHTSCNYISITLKKIREDYINYLGD